MNSIDYFKISQTVKREIEADSDLLSRTRQCFSGELRHFALGTSNRIYRIGKTKSGLYIALREEIRPSSLEAAIYHFEMYCQTAEKEANEYWNRVMSSGARPVAFCIGTIYNGKIAGVITEDLSEDGSYEIIGQMGDPLIIRKKGEIPLDKIIVDLDALYEGTMPDLKYFLEGNRLELKSQIEKIN